MFQLLTDKLQDIFRKLNSKGRLTEKDVDEALREVRLALLEADVHFKVARDFIAKVRERAVGNAVLESLTPAQQVIKIVHEELIDLLGGGQNPLAQANVLPTVVMLIGLQGSGKTTTAAKLALHLKQKGQRPLLVATDVRRPAAITQLTTLGQQVEIPVYGEGASAQAIARGALKRAKNRGNNWLITDTGGRLHIDEPLMAELVELRKELHPSEVLLVADAMTGQDAVRVAEEFQAKVGLTGLILTKLDGDARGGAALSIRSVTGVPIKFIGTGEKTDALDPFYPDRLASRILGMGDVLTLIEKAEVALDAKRAQELAEKMRRATFDLEDFLEQLRQIKRMGSLTQWLEMLPGFSSLSRRLPTQALDDRAMKKIEAIILSMTPQERRNPQIIDGSRRRRIARGSGTTLQDINQLLNQFRQAQKLMKDLTRGRQRGILSLFR